MAGNISLLVCSFFFICLISLYIYRVWPDLNVLDLYIIFCLFHFGLYPFVRGLYFGKDVIFDFRNSNPFIISEIFIHIILILVVIELLYRYLPVMIIENLKIKNLIQKWNLANKFVVVFILVLLITFQIISYYKYGVKSYILPSDFEKIGKDLPYWFTSVRTVIPPLAFLVFLGLMSFLLKSQTYKYLWLILTLVFLTIIILYGRRFFFAAMIIWVTFWLIEKKQDIFSLKYLTIVSVTILSLFFCSNIFQAYRGDFQSVGRFKMETLKNPITAAMNFEATLKNLRARPGTWEFNFLIFDQQFDKDGMTTDGKITLEGIKSSIPRIFWSDKQFVLIDNILANLYGVQPKEIDIGKNLFALGQVETGYFSLIIVPLIIMTIIVMMGALIEISKQYPTFSWLFSGTTLFFIVNIEENGNELFFLLRNICIICLLFVIFLILNKIFMFRFERFKKTVVNLGKESA